MSQRSLPALRGLWVSRFVAAEYVRTGGTVEPRSAYDAAARAWRVELGKRTPGVENVLQSDVHGRLLARVIAVAHDVHAGRLSDELPREIVKQRTGLPQDGGFLRAIGTHSPKRLRDFTWVGLARELLALPLLSSSNTSMERFGCKELCLKCGALSLDSFGFHAMQCPSLLQMVLHTCVKNALFDFVTFISRTHGSRVTGVEKEEPGLVDDNLRPGDVSFK